jgi:hypothetical protein
MKTAEPGSSSRLLRALAWVFFCFTCFQMAFLWPYVVLFPGERVNVFSGVLAVLTLGLAWMSVRASAFPGTRTELAVSLVLVLLAIASGLFSQDPVSSSLRVFVLLGTGVGGFWVGRFLLVEASRQVFFVWFSAAILAGMGAVGFWGYVAHGRPEYFWNTNPHALVNVLMLLSSAPLALLSSRRPVQVLAGILSLSGALLVLYVAATATGLKSALFAPATALVILVALGAWRFKTLAPGFVILLLATAMTAHSVVNSPAEKSLADSLSYRVESYPFSLHVANRSPLLGIGLRQSREEFVDGYEIQHPSFTPENFRNLVSELVTSENAFLTFLCGLGYPFTALYISALSVILFRLMRSIHKPPESSGLPPSALFLPITCSLLHSLVVDTLLYPQINWFFHLFLGMVPLKCASTNDIPRSWKPFIARFATGTLAIVLGAFLGTHPAFSKDNLLGLSGLFSYLKQSPVINNLWPEKPPSLHNGAQSDMGPAPVKQARSQPDRSVLHQRSVNTRLHMMLIIDNSESMAARPTHQAPNLFATAAKFTELLTEAMPPDGQVALRAFDTLVSASLSERELPLRMSYLVSGWRRASADEIRSLLQQIRPSGKNNPCAAALGAFPRDFPRSSECSPRIVLLTDGQTDCLPHGIPDRSPPVDVLRFGEETDSVSGYAQLAKKTGGVLVSVKGPADLESTLQHYLGLIGLTSPKDR